MDKLRNFIDSNREAFEDEMLLTDHLDRFEKKLPKRSNNRTIWLRIGTIITAAAVALFVYFEIHNDLQKSMNQQADTTVCKTQEEIDEVRFYYNMQMNEVTAQIRALYKSEQAPGGIELLEEAKEILKSNNDFEEKILPTLPCSNQGLFAMNQHYTNSLESLNIMLNQMEQITNNNN